MLASRRLLLPAILLLLASKVLATVGVPFDPASHPDFIFVNGALEGMPIKNQASCPAWCESASQTWGVWMTHLPAPRASSFKCLSYGISTCCDWWMRELGMVKGWSSYRSLLHGQRERGLNPRELEAQYYARARDGEDGFYLLPYPMMDSCTHERVPYSLEAYCTLVTAPRPATSYADPLLGEAFALYEGRNHYGMGQEYRVLLQHNWVGGLEKATRVLREGLERHGPLYAGLEMTTPFGLSVHVVAIIGYGTFEGETWFVYQESFGDGSIGPQTGEPPYRMCKATRFNEAYAFPHPLRYSFRKAPEGGYDLVVQNERGRPVDVDRLELGLPGEGVDLQVTHVAAGCYRLRPRAMKEELWSARIRFAKRHHAPQEGTDYLLELKFKGALALPEAEQALFQKLHGIPEEASPVLGPERPSPPCE